MRYARSIQLFSEEGYVHKYWKCHNSEYLLQSEKIKELYMECLMEALLEEKIKLNVKLNCYNLMDNHSHALLHYKNGSENLSNSMRKSHTRFGRRFNDRKKRSGKFSNDRPKTPLIQDQEHLMRAHMYIEANPIRAGIKKFSNLHTYKYSSFKFYAYGIRDKYTHLLEIPEWYLNLGDTPKQRQKKYREIFKKYIGESWLDSDWLFKTFIGDEKWVELKIEFVKNLKSRGDILLTKLKT